MKKVARSTTSQSPQELANATPFISQDGSILQEGYRKNPQQEGFDVETPKNAQPKVNLYGLLSSAVKGKLDQQGFKMGPAKKVKKEKVKKEPKKKKFQIELEDILENLKQKREVISVQNGGESERKRQLDLDIIEMEKQLTEFIWKETHKRF